MWLHTERLISSSNDSQLGVEPADAPPLKVDHQSASDMDIFGTQRKAVSQKKGSVRPVENFTAIK
jgi:hypothetical protein